MSFKSSAIVSLAILLPGIAVAQNVRVEAGKHVNRIPKGCESVVSASIDQPIDTRALANEAICKGAGDMMAEYSYAMTANRRTKNKHGEVKETTTTYEVLIPTLKSGGRARGILVATSHDGVPVAPEELDKQRKKAGERLEKEEARIEREPEITSPANEDATTGMAPIGMYSRIFVHHSSFNEDRGAALSVQSFLQACQLSFVKRTSNEGRDVLIFTFAPSSDAKFHEYEEYIARLSGEIWIDAEDHIVNRLIGRPAADRDTIQSKDHQTADQRPPAVYFEMTRVKEGVWLPHIARINGADYPQLFDGITTDSTQTYSDFIRFSTEIKDVKVSPPNN